MLPNANPLVNACFAGQAAGVRQMMQTQRGRLLANSSDPTWGITPLVAVALSKASQEDCLEMCRNLVELGGADIDQNDAGEGCWPLMQAADCGKHRMAEFLISKGADLLRTTASAFVAKPCEENEQGRSTTTSLWMAAQNNRPRIARLILAAALRYEGAAHATSRHGGRTRAVHQHALTHCDIWLRHHLLH